SRKPFTGGNISVPWLNKEKYNAVEVKGKVKPKGNLKDVDRRIYQLKNIDFNMKHPNKNITNLELMKSGKAPIGEDGKPINLHHLIQKEPGTMLEILHTTHKKYHKVLHQLVEKGDSFRNNPELQQQYDSFRRKYWMWRAEQYEKSLKGGSQ
ncbi:HNH/ENDO VII family nuclease, partial [Bacillus paralicheniformis]